MQLAKYSTRNGIGGIAMVKAGQLFPLRPSKEFPTLAALLEAADPSEEARRLFDVSATVLGSDGIRLLPPIDQQEVWAAGVTYRRSCTARMEESQGAARFYDMVYEAPRPEIFFKATPHRCVGPEGKVRIRADAAWNVPEPELALVINSRKQLVGYTIGNDMSSRDIEGENPLYLPQAKVYDGCCGLGPWITLAGAMPPLAKVNITLSVTRGGQPAFAGQTSLANLTRPPEDLIGWLGRECSFPHGAILLTGTGIVPDDDFTLAHGDRIDIRIDGIGTLSNVVA